MPDTPTRTPMQKVVHHIDQGAVTMYAVDANSAVQRFPDEWSHLPWPPADVDAARERRNARLKEAQDREKAAAEAAAAGLPPPAPEPTPEEQAAIEADAKARAEAADRERKRQEDDAERAKEEAQRAADQALLKSTPPQPDPDARRPRPFGRKGEMTAAERAAADRKRQPENTTAVQEVQAAERSAARAPDRPKPRE